MNMRGNRSYFPIIVGGDIANCSAFIEVRGGVGLGATKTVLKGGAKTVI